MSTPSDRKHYFFVGIGGSGMSALADLMRKLGHTISGSDRGHDQNRTPEKFNRLSQAGITLHPQDGSGVGPGIDFLVISGAVEPTILDLVKGRELGLPEPKHRARVLAEEFMAARGIGVAGTSGKSTVTGMIGLVLDKLGDQPTIVNGAVMPDFEKRPDSLLGNAVPGKPGGLFVAEIDESDGSIELFEHMEIAVLNNVSFDHKPIEILKPMFERFVARGKRGAVINMDDEYASQMTGKNANVITYGLERDDTDLTARNIRPVGGIAGGIEFMARDNKTGEEYPCILAVPGRHNVSNALAALSAAIMLDHPLRQAVLALQDFTGIKRRLEILGTVSGVTVIDDFAHNGDKIAASLDALTIHPGPITVLWQPQGHGPLGSMHEEFRKSFAEGLRPQDTLIVFDPYYAGGTIPEGGPVSAKRLVDDLAKDGINAHHFYAPRGAIPTARDQAMGYVLKQVKPGDRIIVMGARDDTLTEYALQFLGNLQQPSSGKIARSP